ncbi:protein FAM47E isoform X2 [Cynoglossus semilaevis]|uniref:protein FAM47E isoform X2 n=1 Tax=Cynoglossus semilaevis TaxID=244447 RepID=UPI000D62F158|nr:uncharacterized protein LOC103397713 isoform X2 [Cynoglossus semilaevis]
MDTKHDTPKFPWYKERLQTKCLKTSTNTWTVFSGQTWSDVSLGNLSSASVFSVTQSGVAPVFSKGLSPNYISPKKPGNKVNKGHTCASKHERQRDHVTAVEEELRKHPLSTFPHYKDHMTSELFLRVASVLDPDLIVNMSSLPAAEVEHEEEVDKENCTQPKITSDTRHPSPRNPHVLQMNKGCIKKSCMVKVKAQVTLNGHEDMEVLTNVFKKWFVPQSEDRCD